MKTPPKVALLVETSNAYSRGILRGVVNYLKGYGPWSLSVSEHTRGEKGPSWLSGWNGDGIIARVENKAMARALQSVDVPVIDVSAARLLPSLPWFETDDRAIAQLAAEHLLERGFTQFAFAGDARFNWSNWREQHFQQFIREAGYKCHCYVPSRRFSPDDDAQVEDFGDWIDSLPKPVGIMACYDFRGQQLLDACRRRDITVPDEVAVIGVDNDELLCELSDPPLSSVSPNALRTGYEAAALLARLMKEGVRGKSETHLIAPLGVVTRQSTDVLAIHDRNVARAINFIRKNACSGINVQDVIAAHPQSRRVMEKQFRKLLGRTPHEEILRVQLNRVKQLLQETDLSLELIAEQTGFSHVEYLSVTFKRELGVPPSRYRTLNRPQGAGLI